MLHTTQQQTAAAWLITILHRNSSMCSRFVGTNMHIYILITLDSYTGISGGGLPVPPPAAHRLGPDQRERHAAPASAGRGGRAVPRPTSAVPQNGGQGPFLFHQTGTAVQVVYHPPPPPSSAKLQRPSTSSVISMPKHDFKHGALERDAVVLLYGGVEICPKNYCLALPLFSSLLRRGNNIRASEDRLINRSELPLRLLSLYRIPILHARVHT